MSDIKEFNIQTDVCTEVWTYIFSLLDGEDMFVLPRVCTNWRQICQNDLTIDHITWSNDRLSIDNFISMLQRFHAVKSLVFAPCNKKHTFCDLDLAKIGDLFSNLTSINLTSTNMNSYGFEEAMLKFPSLKHITLKKAGMFTLFQRHLTFISKCSELETLRLDGCELTEKGILDILEKCKRLKFFDMCSCDIAIKPPLRNLFSKLKNYNIEILSKCLNLNNEFKLSDIEIINGTIYRKGIYYF